MKKILLSIFAVLFAFAGVQAQVWTKVTNASDLKAGDKIVIVAKDYNYAIGKEQGNNNRSQAAVTKSGNDVSWSSGVQEIELQAGTKTGTFAFYVEGSTNKATKGYLYAASSSSNYLRTETTLTANSSWAITIAADGTATVKAQGTYTRNVMQYNQSSSLFACYSSASQKAICIYKYTEGGGTVAGKAELPNVSVANNSTIEAGSEITITPAADNTVSYTINGGNHVVIRDGKPVTITAEQAGTMTLAITTVCNSNDETLTTTYKYTVKPHKPSINADATSFEDELEVSITAEDGASIYYTTDGNDPTTSSTLYEAPFTITETRTVKAIAVSNGVASDVAEVTYTKNEPLPDGWIVDVLNRELTGITKNSTDYSNWSGKTVSSDAVYAGQSAGGNDAIQLRSNNENSGIVTTKSGGKAKKVVVEWQSSTANGRTLNVYGKNSAYTAATDLYNSSNQGTLLGTIVKGTSTELEIEGDYEYIGMRSASSAMYLTSISITWDESAGVTPVAPNAPVLPDSTPFEGSMLVEITGIAADATVYYTTDESDPATSATRVEYTEPFEIIATTTVKAVAVNEVGASEMATATYTLFVVEETEGYYVKVASEPADWSGKYLVVYEEGADAYVFNGKDETNGYVAATIDGGVIKANGELDAVAVTIAAMDGGYSISTVGGYMYKTAYSNGVDFGETAKAANTFEIAEDGVVITSGNNEDKTTFRYNKAVDQMRFRYYKSGQQPVQLYKYVTELPSHQLSVTAAGYATLFLDFNAAIPAEVEAYTVTEVNDGYVTLTQVEGVLPANTGVIVKAAENDYTFAYSTDEAADVTGNLLKGSVTDKNIEGEAYVLGVVDGEVGLYKALANGTSWLNNANKAYLPASAVPNKTVAFYGFDWDGTTGIEEVKGENGEVKTIYDLTGRRVEEITAPGIYIVGGKKVLVK